MKHVITIIMTLAITASSHAFVLMGPTPDGDELTLNTGNTGNFVAIQSSNVGRDRYQGTPKDRTRFFRLSTPYLTYGFDQQFVRFFGQEGINAVDDAMRAINDFFQPEDGSYNGVSELNLNNSGFAANHATYWLNVTAANQSLIDMKSVTLGYVVNLLGLGNPHRYAFTAYELDNNMTQAQGTAIFRVRNNNYDPFDPINVGTTDQINGVQYSYRLVHNQLPGVDLSQWTAAGGQFGNLIADMEEYTTDSGGNEFSAIAGIIDAFYGSTDIAWVSPPSQFNYGVYYDGINAAGGAYQPRHALTLDDAGGLKYLYSTNTLAMEFNPHQAVANADYVGGIQSAFNEQNNLISASGRYVRPGNEVRLAPTPSNPVFRQTARPVFPVRRGAGAVLLPGNTITTGINNTGLPTPANHPLFHLQNAPGGINTFMTGGANASFTGSNVGMMRWAYRGGVDKINMVKLTYDSLLDITPNGTNFAWVDTFITNLNVNIANNGGVPGAGNTVAGRPQYFTQVVGRNVAAPDILFGARQIDAINGVPVAFENNATFDFNGTTAGSVLGGYAGGIPEIVRPDDPTFNEPVVVDASRGITDVNGSQNPQSARALGAADNGPGIWAPDDSATTFNVTFDTTYNFGGFEVLWSGELTVDANASVPAVINQQWAHIYGPGPSDFVKFPDNENFVGAQSYYSAWENSILPVTGVPVISLVSKNGNNSPVGNNSLYRTTDTLTVKGTNFRNATAVEILDQSGATLELIYPIDSYIKNNTLIEIPVGRLELGSNLPVNTLSKESEGTNRRLRVWNQIGASELNANPFAIKTGPVVLTGTSHDGSVYYRNQAITLYGYGFTSSQVDASDGNANLTHIQLIDATGNAVFPVDGNTTNVGVSLHVVSDNKAYLLEGSIPASADGVNLRLIVSRGTGESKSSPQPNPMTIVSGVPDITEVTWEEGATTYIVGDEPLRRDKPLTITGTGLFTTSRIELVTENGQSFVPPVAVDQALFQVRGINLTPDGTTITIPANVFDRPSADGFGAKRAKLLVTNGADIALAGPFNVNMSPVVTAITGFHKDESGTGGHKYFHRGLDEIVITGNGLSAIQYLRLQGADSTGGAGTFNIAVADRPSIERNAMGSTPGIQILWNDDTKTETLKLNFGPNTGYGTTALANTANADANSTEAKMVFELVPGNTANGGAPRIAGTYALLGTGTFLVGARPIVTGLNLSNGTAFQRDHDNATLTGDNLHIVESVEIVDNQGVAFNTALLAYNPATINDTSKLEYNPGYSGLGTGGTRIDLNGTLINYANGQGEAADSIVPDSRLFKVTTPWGSTDMHLIPGINPFRISGVPQFNALDDPANNITGLDWPTYHHLNDNNTTTYTGSNTLLVGGFTEEPGNHVGGYDLNGTAGDPANNGYEPLVLNGAGFLGVNRIQFIGKVNGLGAGELPDRTTPPIDNRTLANHEIFIDTNEFTSPPAGITITATSITIDGKFIYDNNVTWAQSADYNGTAQTGYPETGPVLNYHVWGAPRQVMLYTPAGDFMMTNPFETNSTMFKP